MADLIKEGNVAYEGFTPIQLTRARFVWNQASRAAELAVSAVRQFDPPANAELIARWFGLRPGSNPQQAQQLMQVQSKLQQLADAFRGGPVTLVYRPDIVVKTAPYNPNEPQLPVTLAGGTAFTGQNVYGYVHRHQAGSGMRVVLGRWFMDDPDPQEATQTLYHELTHKVASTVDHCYGTDACQRLAATAAQQACNNADNFGYFAKAMVAAV